MNVTYFNGQQARVIMRAHPSRTLYADSFIRCITIEERVHHRGIASFIRLTLQVLDRWSWRVIGS